MVDTALLEEGKQFIQLNDKFKRTMCPDQGPGFLIAT